MAIKLYDDTNFVMIASAIRAKNGLETQYKPSEMATAINALKMAKDVEPNNTSSGLNVNFKDGADGEKYNSLILNIPPLQDGTGDPSPTNKRDFKNYARFILYYSGADKTDYETYTLNHSTLGGSIDLISGEESYFNVSMRLANYSNSITTYTENGVTIFYLPNASSFGDIYSESLKTVEKMSSLSEAAQNMPNNSIAGSKGAAQSSIGFFIRADSFSTVSELIASIGTDDNYPTTWMETNTITSGLFTGRTELGVNNLWAIGYQVYDEQLSQDIPLEVSYKADPILYTQGVVMDMLPQDQVTGAVANFPDGSANPIVEGIFSIVPNQSGTGDPSPSNVRPISGFTGMDVTRIGKNLIPTSLPSNTINATFSSTEIVTSAINARTFFLEIPKNTNFIYSCSQRAEIVLGLSNEILSVGDTLTYLATLTQRDTYSFNSGNNKYLVVSVTSVAMFNSLVEKNCQIETGSTATSYESYQTPTTKSVTWADSAGTVYGGSLNLTTGVLTVNRVFYEIDGTEESLVLDSTTGVCRVTLDRLVVSTVPASSGAICSHAIYSPTSTSAMPNNSFGLRKPSGFMYFKNTSLTTLQDFIDFFANQKLNGTPFQVSYILEEPTTYQLTPQELNTLLGTNNIYCDTGDSDIKYRADIDLYIQKKIAEG